MNKRAPSKKIHYRVCRLGLTLEGAFKCGGEKRGKELREVEEDSLQPGG